MLVTRNAVLILPDQLGFDEVLGDHWFIKSEIILLEPDLCVSSPVVTSASFITDIVSTMAVSSPVVEDTELDSRPTTGADVESPITATAVLGSRIKKCED